jgi:hypothetical protein
MPKRGPRFKAAILVSERGLEGVGVVSGDYDLGSRVLVEASGEIKGFASSFTDRASGLACPSPEPLSVDRKETER